MFSFLFFLFFCDIFFAADDNSLELACNRLTYHIKLYPGCDSDFARLENKGESFKKTLQELEEDLALVCSANKFDLITQEDDPCNFSTIAFFLLAGHTLKDRHPSIFTDLQNSRIVIKAFTERSSVFLARNLDVVVLNNFTKKIALIHLFLCVFKHNYRASLAFVPYKSILLEILAKNYMSELDFDFLKREDYNEDDYNLLMKLYSKRPTKKPRGVNNFFSITNMVLVFFVTGIFVTIALQKYYQSKVK